MIYRVKNIVILLFGIIILSPTRHSGADPGLTVVFTGNSNGVLESCRCPGNPFGGLVQRKTVIDSLRSDYPDALVVDTGDFLSISPDPLKAEFVIKAMEFCKYDAIVPGDQDLKLIHEYIGRTDLPLLCTNRDGILGTKGSIISSKLEFSPSGKRVLIIGFFAPVLGEFIPELTQVEVDFKQPLDIWRDEIEPIKTDFDFILALSHQGYDRDIDLLNEIDGIDLLISGHSQMLLEKPEKHGDTWVGAAGKNAEYVGVARFSFTGNEIALDEYRVIPLVAENVSESAEIAKLITGYNLAHRKRLRDKALAAGRTYFGTDVCRRCHQPEYEQWKSTPHAKALQTLRDAGKENSSSCLECHTTGFGFPGGYDESNPYSTQHGVGCEECHVIQTGPDGFSSGMHKSLKVERRQCVRCHLKPHIVNFDYESMRKKVTHRNQD